MSTKLKARMNSQLRKVHARAAKANNSDSCKCTVCAPETPHSVATAFVNRYWKQVQIVGDAGERIPEKETVATLLADLITVRGTAVGAGRFMMRPRKGASDDTYVLLERLRWHGVIRGGSSSLWGPMMSSYRTDKVTWDALDTFSHVVGACLGRVSASAAWVRALRGGE